MLTANDPDREARAAYKKWFDEFWRDRDKRPYKSLTIDFKFGKLVWEAAISWNAARRPDAGLRVTEGAVIALLDKWFCGPGWDRDCLEPMRDALEAALPHLRPDVGRDEEKPNAERQVCDDILTIMATYDEQMSRNACVDTPGGLEHMGDVWSMLDGWRNAINANRARAEDKEAGA